MEFSGRVSAYIDSWTISSALWKNIEPGVVVQACYFSTQEAEAGLLHIQAQPGIQREL